MSKKQYDVTGNVGRESHNEIWIHTSGLDKPERLRSAVLDNGETKSSWTIFEIHSNGSWNLHKVEIQSGRSTANYLTDIDTRYSRVQDRVQEEDLIVQTFAQR